MAPVAFARVAGNIIARIPPAAPLAGLNAPRSLLLRARRLCKARALHRSRRDFPDARGGSADLSLACPEVLGQFEFWPRCARGDVFLSNGTARASPP